MEKTRTTRSLAEELPIILHERGLSLRKLADSVGVGNDHLSRVLSGARGKKPTGDLARRVAEALGLPADYFPEARLQYVVEHLGAHPLVRDQVYDELRHPD